ncbi:MAG: hypothetical protein ACD_81C00100G0010 [uncultured bacterium]|uniref:Uncharacterized protein n=1 Tax=Candidatus Wolfebacteria bacterium GW2011_GWE2_44_13 TaxID=1619017 RepID=A0A0G1H909_9BACT|nr:MAG: hypothetical protein ACD_81C00100G0010 [uncultured bacterium]KKT42988.1 MAG: hypothetical protein UW32_C0003G0091 [Candidatus Wolfebacteria bacterium GW2011_GWE2_44_13]
MTTSTIATTSNLDAIKSLLITTNIQEFAIFAIPILFLVGSIRLWMHYNHINGDRDTQIQDILDERIYTDMVAPLRDVLADNLVEEVSRRISDIPEGTDVKDFFQDEYKLELIKGLKSIQYKAIEEVIEFQVKLENLIKGKKSRVVLKKCSRQNNTIALGVAVLSCLQIIDGIVIIATKNSPISSWGAVGWLVLQCIVLVFGGKYVLNEKTIDNLKNV